MFLMQEAMLLVNFFFGALTAMVLWAIAAIKIPQVIDDDTDASKAFLQVYVITGAVITGYIIGATV